MLPMPTGPTGADAALFQALVENSSDAIALVDPDGMLRYASRSLERVLGYTPEERLDRSGFELIHEDDMPLVAEAFARAAALPGTPQTLEFRVRQKDGSWRYIEAVAVNRLSEPAVGGIVISCRDVSERQRAADALSAQAIAREISKQKNAETRLRQSEARYRSLIQGAAYGIFRSTMDGTILDANPAFAQMLGYQSVDEISAVNMRDICTGAADRAALIERFRLSAEATLSEDLRWKRKDGETIVVRLTAHVVDLEGEGASCFDGIAEDITEKRALEEQLRQSQKMEAVGRLARGIAHDFNNVLAAIMGNSDLLQLQLKEEDPMYQDVQEISRAAERGASLTRQLMAFSRRQATEPETLDLHEVVRGFDSMLQRLSGDIELRLHTPGPPPLVRVEPGQIEQVVMNLVVNARDAVPEGGTINVHADLVTVDAHNGARYPAVPPGRYARVAVRDTGAGIDPTIERHVFEPFFTTKDPAKGTGLGLSIVYGIAKEAGGAVTFSSAPGAGTIFEVLLPVAKPATF
jgi:PAS domain S-box-containing protein